MNRHLTLGTGPLPTRDRVKSQESGSRMGSPMGNREKLHNYQGPGAGRDEEASEALGKTLKNPLTANKWKMIQSDGIFTPWRAYQRRGSIPNCEYCGEEQCDFEHLLWECSETYKTQDTQRDWVREREATATQVPVEHRKRRERLRAEPDQQQHEINCGFS